MTQLEKKQVRFYDPYPGFLGALLPLPKIIRETAKKLDGKIMTLEEALDILNPQAEKVGGSVEIAYSHSFISFDIQSSIFHHSYRLIRYKEKDKENENEVL